MMRRRVLVAVGLLALGLFVAGGLLTSGGTTVTRSSSGATAIVTSGWENGGTGCSAASLSDGGTWTGYNVGTYCVAAPTIEVVSDDVHSGSHAIRKNQLPGDIGDGGGFETVLLRNFRPPLSEWYLRYYVKYSSNYYWHADMKAIITGSAAVAQEIYAQTRPYYTNDGVGPDNTRARIALFFVTERTLVESANVAIARNRWYLLEEHFRASTTPTTADGLFEMKVDGVPVTWSETNLPNTGFRTGANRFTYFKWSTYTNGSGDAAFQAAMPMSFLLDDLQVCTDGWCGGS
jgi:hypothetical protein